MQDYLQTYQATEIIIVMHVMNMHNKIWRFLEMCTLLQIPLYIINRPYLTLGSFTLVVNL